MGWTISCHNESDQNRSRLSKRRFISILLWLSVGSIFLFDVCAQSNDLHAINNEGFLVGRIHIEILGTGNDSDHWKRAAENLIAIPEGTIISSEKIDQMEANLKSTGLFTVEKMETRKNETGNLDIHFQLRIMPRIQEIKITGNFPVFEREILNAMTIYTGDAFQKEIISQQQSLIVRLLKDQGYISPKVSLHPWQDRKSGHYILHVELHKGPFFRVDHFEIEGNRSFTGIRIKSRLNMWKSSFLPGGMSRYQKKELDEDVRNLTAFYRKSHFPEVKITPRVVMDEAAQKVRIVLHISEGPLYEIGFKGNDQFWDWTLRDDLQVFREGAANDYWVRKTARTIRERYFKKGYVDCRVRMEIEPESPIGMERKVYFIIEEGKRSIVRDLKIIGNSSIPEDKIQKQIITEIEGVFSSGEFVRQILDDDIRGVITLYLKKGYPYVKVEEEISWTEDKEHHEKYADIIFKITEGQKITVSSVLFDGLSGLSEEWAMDKLDMKPGDPFREYMIQSDKNNLAMHISEAGYPHVRIQEKKTINPETAEAEITYEISQGPYVKTGELLTVGNFRTRKKVIDAEFTLEEGAPFSMMNMIEGQRNIQNINAFKSARVKPLGLKEISEKVDFLVEVEEKKPYALEASIGYDTSKKLFLNSRLSDLNLMGLNKEAWVELEGSQIGNRGEIGLTEPRLLDTRISASANLFWEKREELNVGFGTEGYGLTVSFIRKLPYNMSARLAIGYERKEQYLRDGESFSDDDQEAYDPRGILVTSPSIVYNSVDSFIRPQKGMFTSIGMDFSRGLENSLDNFITYRSEIRMYSQIYNRIVFAVRGRAGHIVPSGEKSVIPEDQLFFLGGLSSVRGYDENRLRIDREGAAMGGRTELLGSMEVRFDIGFNLELAPFYDIGSVRNALTEEGEDSFRSSTGLSLRYITPYFPVGIQYGYMLDRQESDKNNGRLYFSIGYTF
ncbi:MAG: outer membrane protein assembly factor BamA [Desulfobacteraceae bacterium]|nr:MAG: outer membrane protein assembly factor BamA [Desulfobacteraceae bacterium]